MSRKNKVQTNLKSLLANSMWQLKNKKYAHQKYK
jgi:hypothetical protein